jgi:hypothetical protein
VGASTPPTKPHLVNNEALRSFICETAYDIKYHPFSAISAVPHNRPYVKHS